MAYAAWSVIAGEQPTAAKWNILGTNDASFNDGSGLAFTTNNVVPANALATRAIYLGGTQTSSLTQTGFSAQTDVTGMSVTVTVPAGTRELLIIGQFTATFTVAADEFRGQINEGATILAANQIIAAGSGKSQTFIMYAHPSTPSAGSHTYKLTGVRISGTGTMAPVAVAGLPADITVYAT